MKILSDSIDPTNDFLFDCCYCFPFRLGARLGSGQFGEVFKGELETTEGKLDVAVKTLKEGAGEEDRVKFLQEAAIMGQFRHPNVITMYGVITNKELVRLFEVNVSEEQTTL